MTLRVLLQESVLDCVGVVIKYNLGKGIVSSNWLGVLPIHGGFHMSSFSSRSVVDIMILALLI